MLIQGIVAGDVETGRLGHEPRREVHLRTPCVPCLRNHPGVGNGTIAADKRLTTSAPGALIGVAGADRRP